MKTKLNRLRVVSITSILLMMVSGGLVACSDDDPDTGQNFVAGGDTGDDDPDTGQPDGDGSGGEEDTGPDTEVDPCEDVSCMEGQECVDGQCREIASPGYSCSEPYDLGVISAGDHVTQLADPRGEPNLLNTQCSVNDESPQAVFSFSVDEVLRITLDAALTNPDLVHRMARDIRVDACTAQIASDDCSADTGVQEFIAEPGHDYYIIVEARTGFQIAELEIDLQTEGVTCHPAGALHCEDGQLVQCHAGDEERFFDCVDGCTDGICHGDSCAHPIEVRDSMTVTANLDAYNNEFNFSSETAGCSSSGDGITTSGQDLVFSLPDLMGDETIAVTRPDSSFAIGVMQSCAGPLSCIDAHSSGTDYQWEVPEAGDYFLVLNRYSPGSGEVEFSIDFVD